MTPVIEVMRQIARLWEGLSSSEGNSRLRIKHYNEKESLSMAVMNRAFRFGLPERLGPRGISYNRSMSTVEWEFEVQYWLSGSGHGYFSMVEAVVSDINLLAERIDLAEQWPPGVLQVDLLHVGPEETDEGVLITFRFRVLTDDD